MALDVCLCDVFA
ncbi:hypothetical protein V4V60_003764 [Vibrio mimicus]|nr:hypothetical protein [Vibrio cholerae]EJL6905666.1 hypothetical protein [Vibrio cholerae]ELL0578589.1 hypothetical protein [Vibrio cholerae]ELT7226432.1 hypothetical protein [Vibrio cholerae]